MSAESLANFRDDRQRRGIQTTPELDQAIARIGNTEAHHKAYAKMSRLQKFLHRRTMFKDSRNWCMECHR